MVLNHGLPIFFILAIILYMPDLEELIYIIKEKNPVIDDASLELIETAFDYAAKAHHGQKRLTGEDYLNHPFNTAKTLAELNVDPQTIAAGLLHDIPENTDLTIDDLRQEFGKEIAVLVDGVTKLGTVKYRGLERYVENLRRMFMAMTKDIRVIVIRLADRLDNMKTLDVHPEEKKLRIAKETMEIYAPTANRLGIGELKGLLEDWAFFYLDPKNYQWTKNLAKERLAIQLKYIEKIKKILTSELRQNNIKNVILHGRVKHYYSLYKKLLRKDKDINKVYDLVALRIVVGTIPECYMVLGLIHKKWIPLKGRIKDYIAQPKPNGYQSIHTTVFTERGKIVEFQIRTEEMHDLAEYGIAAHWRYKEESGARKKQTIWIKQLLEIQKLIKDDKKYIQNIKLNVFQNRIFAFTPKGDVIDLPEDATPVDFAYHIHTEIGNKCAGARINEEIVPLNTTLKSGDVVEIIINKNRKKPNQDWLEFVKTNVAKDKIRIALKKS